eukprot:TRINITY_DN40221_c0_g1_i1.p1 TRINITY_DN40221_c0_g1~~TRINITY_DN40221_c0_g1_i1.p1  ORF type:complete len:314 (+),score=78.09 TRINITY_DN40221_c0_g1_i1:23-943(+)
MSDIERANPLPGTAAGQEKGDAPKGEKVLELPPVSPPVSARSKGEPESEPLGRRERRLKMRLDMQDKIARYQQQAEAQLEESVQRAKQEASKRVHRNRRTDTQVRLPEAPRLRNPAAVPGEGSNIAKARVKKKIRKQREEEVKKQREDSLVEPDVSDQEKVEQGRHQARLRAARMKKKLQSEEAKRRVLEELEHKPKFDPEEQERRIEELRRQAAQRSAARHHREKAAEAEARAAREAAERLARERKKVYRSPRKIAELIESEASSRLKERPSEDDASKSDGDMFAKTMTCLTDEDWAIHIKLTGD